jgi:nitrous oxide reductase accessory protein NosL
MALVQRWNVEACFGTTPLYLSHIPGIGMRWSTDAEEAFEYDDREEAEADAEANGGEVFRFERLMRRTDVESFSGHNADSRLQHHYQIAAE